MKARPPSPPAFWRNNQDHPRQMRDYLVHIGDVELKNWHSIHVSAPDMSVLGANPPAFVSPPPSWRFDGVAINESIYLGYALPFAWEPGIDDRVYLDVHWAKTTNAAGGVRWSVDLFFARPNNVIPAATTLAADTPLATTVDTNTADKHLITRVGPFTTPAGAVRMLALLQLTRLQSHANDTYGADASLLGVDLHFFNMGMCSPEIPS